jgi:hypothetical protein
LRERPALIVGAIVGGVLLLTAAWPAAAHYLAKEANTAWANEADSLGLQAAASLGAQARNQPEIVSSGLAEAPSYLNPLRDVPNLVPERVDQGVDFGGSGPVYALGDGTVTNAQAYNSGWGGGWITYLLTDGPAAGLEVYVAEDITPTVQVGQQVTPYTVVGNMFNGGEGIETGWAQPGGVNAESQLAVAGSIAGLGPFPTNVGLNFEELLLWLGAPAAPNRYDTPSGLLPSNYPAEWG